MSMRDRIVAAFMKRENSYPPSTQQKTAAPTTKITPSVREALEGTLDQHKAKYMRNAGQDGQWMRGILRRLEDMFEEGWRIQVIHDSSDEDFTFLTMVRMGENPNEADLEFVRLRH